MAPHAPWHPMPHGTQCPMPYTMAPHATHTMPPYTMPPYTILPYTMAPYALLVTGVPVRARGPAGHNVMGVPARASTVHVPEVACAACRVTPAIHRGSQDW